MDMGVIVVAAIVALYFWQKAKAAPPVETPVETTPSPAPPPPRPEVPEEVVLPTAPAPDIAPGIYPPGFIYPSEEEATHIVEGQSITLLTSKIERITDPVFPGWRHPSGQWMSSWQLEGEYPKITMKFRYNFSGMAWANIGLQGYHVYGLYKPVGLIHIASVYPGSGEFTVIVVLKDGGTHTLNPGGQLGYEWAPPGSFTNIELEILAGRAKGVLVLAGSVGTVTKPYTAMATITVPCLSAGLRHETLKTVIWGLR